MGRNFLFPCIQVVFLLLDIVCDLKEQGLFDIEYCAEVIIRLMWPLISPTSSEGTVLELAFNSTSSDPIGKLDGKDTTGLFYLDVKESTKNNQHYSSQQARISWGLQHKSTKACRTCKANTKTIVIPTTKPFNYKVENGGLQNCSITSTYIVNAKRWPRELKGNKTRQAAPQVTSWSKNLNDMYLTLHN